MPLKHLEFYINTIRWMVYGKQICTSWLRTYDHQSSGGHRDVSIMIQSL